MMLENLRETKLLFIWKKVVIVKTSKEQGSDNCKIFRTKSIKLT